MKKILWLAPVLALLTLLGSCKKIDDLLTFYIDDSQTIKIAGNFPIGRYFRSRPFPCPPARKSTSPKTSNTSADSSEGRDSLDRAHAHHHRPRAAENFDFSASSISSTSAPTQSDRQGAASLAAITCPPASAQHQLTPSQPRSWTSTCKATQLHTSTPKREVPQAPSAVISPSAPIPASK